MGDPCPAGSIPVHLRHRCAAAASGSHDYSPPDDHDRSRRRNRHAGNVRRRLHTEHPHHPRPGALPPCCVRGGIGRSRPSPRHSRAGDIGLGPHEHLVGGRRNEHAGRWRRRVLPDLTHPRRRVRGRGRARALSGHLGVDRLLRNRVCRSGRGCNRNLEHRVDSSRGRCSRACTGAHRIRRCRSGDPTPVRRDGPPRAGARIVLPGRSRGLRRRPVPRQPRRGRRRCRLLGSVRHLLSRSDRFQPGRRNVRRSQGSRPLHHTRNVRRSRPVDRRLPQCDHPPRRHHIRTHARRRHHDDHG